MSFVMGVSFAFWCPYARMRARNADTLAQVMSGPMALTTPDEQFATLKTKIEETLRGFFPIGSGRSKIVLNGIEVNDNLDSEDLRSQQEAIKRKHTWAVPVYADLSLVRNDEVVDRQRVMLLRLPKVTQRFGYIIGGNENQVLNQFRQKSGVYHHIAGNGEIRARFNLANPEGLARGRSFDINLDPASGIFKVEYDGVNVPVYPLLKGAGVSDESMQAAWGQKVYEANERAVKPRTAYNSFAKKVLERKIDNPEEHAGLFGQLLEKTKLRPDTTLRTLGRAVDRVDTDVVLRSTKNLLGISRGDRNEDDRSSLEFQSVHSFEDLLSGQIQRDAKRIRSRILARIDKRQKVPEIIDREAFDKAVHSFFQSSLRDTPEQTNPLEMLSGNQKTTIMGEQGGVKSSFAIDESAKIINPSHLGYLDPVHTPESEKTGISLTLPLGTRKVGNELVSDFRDAKSGQRVHLTPGQAMAATIAFPDQFTTVGKVPRPVGKHVKATQDGKVVYVNPKDVDYILPSPRGVFGIATNLIPFLQNNQGNRAMTAARQGEQAVPLVHREAPLVQAQTDREQSFEELLGHYAARRSPVDGVVTEIKNDAVIVKGERGKKTEVQFYRDFGLKGHTLYDSEVRVKAGDKVKAGDLLADSTFTKNGVLALGTNLRAAYLPFHGYNFEDGIVISDEAAKKLTSLHMYEDTLVQDSDTTVKKSTFEAVHPGVFNKEQLTKVDQEGIIRVGQVVEEGDPLILALRKPTATQVQSQIAAFRRGQPPKERNAALTWNKPFKGVVTDVFRRKGGEIVVNIRTEEPAQIGDKIVGRHGNKGVITRVVPQAQMPYSFDSKGEKRYVDVALNPLGVPGRINLGQILETVAGKLAEERGEIYKVRNFEPGKDYLEDIKTELKDAGLTDKEVLINPQTGKPYDQPVLLGNQYIFKLKHQIEKKISARATWGQEGALYDVNQSPKGGAPHGGQSMGELGLYSMLAHGARENIYDMYAYKTSRSDNKELWKAIRDGRPLPSPKVPFAYDKFLNYLKALRVNVDRKGSELQLIPFTEGQISQLSFGELPEPGAMFIGKNLKPEEGGLFDPKITGGKEGTRWSHFTLQEPMPNPVFESPIRKLLSIPGKKKTASGDPLSDADFARLLRGDIEVRGHRGGAAMLELLKDIDVKKEIADIQAKLKTRKSGRDALHSRLRILLALDRAGLDPTVYMMRTVPVMPPIFRPVVAKQDGSLSSEDVNGLYVGIASINESLQTNKEAHMPNSYLGPIREGLYDGLKALAGTGGSVIDNRNYSGILDLISGNVRKPHGERGGAGKHGFFQKRVIKRRQDFSGRSIIIPEPRMGIDELGLPEDIAWVQYQPFIERRLMEEGYIGNDAIAAVKNRTPAAEHALVRAMAERPVLLKRDPALHKFNVMAFKPRLVRGKAIEIHPLVTSGYNADFDGDAMSVYLPLSPSAVKESYSMMPSNNLFSATTGGVMYTPGHEALLGLYLLSRPGEKTGKAYKTSEEALSAMRRGQIKPTDVIRVGGQETTAGRLQIEMVLPDRFRETGKKKASEMRVFDKKVTGQVLLDIAKNDPKLYGEVANHFKDLGNEYSTELGYSIGLDDFSVINKAVRDRTFSAAETRAAAVRERHLPRDKEERLILDIFEKVRDELDEVNDAHLKDNPTNISLMVFSGSRGKPEQLKQIVSTPALVQDAKSRTVPSLISRSYAEGMDLSSYWTTLHGARKGTVQKVQGVRKPGYLSKQILNSTMNQLVTEDDCGTQQGIWLSVDDPDVMDRYLAAGQRFGKTRFQRNELVDTSLVASAKKAETGRIFVRSPMRCESEDGICKKCAGLAAGGSHYRVGDNLGVMAGQAVGEPSTQLALNAFHTGGVAKGAAARSQSTFDRLNQLLMLPKIVIGKGPLAKEDGEVSRVEAAGQGGQNVFIGDAKHYVPAGQTLRFKQGEQVRQGDALSDGVIDPRELLQLKGIDAVQDYIAEEIHNLLKSEVKVRRRNVEVVVKALTNITKVQDAASHPEWVPEDVRPTSKVEAWNREHPGNKVEHRPLLKGINMLPLEMSEDWVAHLNFQRLTSTIQQGAAEGWKSNIHGFHPIPAVALGVEFGKGQHHLGEKWKGQY